MSGEVTVFKGAATYALTTPGKTTVSITKLRTISSIARLSINDSYQYPQYCNTDTLTTMNLIATFTINDTQQ